MAAADSALAPIVMKVALPCPPERAFDYFTRDIGGWWPLGRYSCAGDDAVDVAFETRKGGALTERARDGTLHRWGTVTAWEPGRRVAFTWHPGSSGLVESVQPLMWAALGLALAVLVLLELLMRRPDGLRALRESRG